MIRDLVDIHNVYGGTHRVFAAAPDLRSMREGIRRHCERHGIACAGFTLLEWERRKESAINPPNEKALTPALEV